MPSWNPPSQPICWYRTPGISAQATCMLQNDSHLLFADFYSYASPCFWCTINLLASSLRWKYVSSSPSSCRRMSWFLHHGFHCCHLLYLFETTNGILHFIVCELWNFVFPPSSPLSPYLFVLVSVLRGSCNSSPTRSSLLRFSLSDECSFASTSNAWNTSDASEFL